MNVSEIDTPSTDDYTYVWTPLALLLVFVGILVVIVLLRRVYADRRMAWLEECVGTPEQGFWEAFGFRSDSGGKASERTSLLGSAADTGDTLWVDARDLAFCAASIIGTQTTYAYLQEELMTTEYIEEGHEGPGEYFLFSGFATLLNRLFAMGLAAVFMALKIWRNDQQCSTSATVPKWEFSVGAMAINLSTVCNYDSLQYLSFPTITLTKAIKMVPIMLVNRVVFGQRYAAFEYTGSLITAMGAFMFLFKGGDADELPDTPAGVLLMIGYVQPCRAPTPLAPRLLPAALPTEPRSRASILGLL
jgi:hypothetical protein